MRKLFLIFCVAFIGLALPIYGTGRIIIPNLIKQKVIDSLPNGSVLTVGKIKTENDLTIIYDNVSFRNGSLAVSMPQLLLKPRVSIKNPFMLEAPKIIIENVVDKIILDNISIKILPSNLLNPNINYEGKIGKVDLNEQHDIEDLLFLISEFDNLKPRLQLNASQLKASYVSPMGLVLLQVSDLLVSTDFSKLGMVDIRGEKIKLDLNNIRSSDQEQVMNADKAIVSINFIASETWAMPFDVELTSIRSQTEKIADKMVMSGDAVWQEKSLNCGIYELIKDVKSCGQIINITDFLLLLEDRIGKFKVSGDGFCVAPNSGCPQRIFATVMTDDTAAIFSNIMRSGVVNPLVGGILLGGLLSSPVRKPSDYDHILDMKIFGSQIFLNDQPLIK